VATGAEQSGGGFPVDPLHQFVVQPLIPLNIGGLDASFTNASLWMVVTVVAITVFTTLGMRSGAMVPGRMQSVVESFYTFIANMVRDNAGHDAMRFFPFIFSLFAFIFFANMIGMFPYAFTVTSHIVVTFVLAGTVFVGVTLTGFVLHGAKFLRVFVPSGVPMALLPLVVAIEIISYFSRPISHSVRLFANMLAGHIMLKVFAGFVITFMTMGAIGWAGMILPLFMIICLTALEFLVAALQAYVFTILTCEVHRRRYCVPRHGRRRHRRGPDFRQLPGGRAAQPVGGRWPVRPSDFRLRRDGSAGHLLAARRAHPALRLIPLRIGQPAASSRGGRRQANPSDRRPT
jgi:F-type H+-transporting ATPase subunit a